MNCLRWCFKIQLLLAPQVLFLVSCPLKPSCQCTPTFGSIGSLSSASSVSSIRSVSSDSSMGRVSSIWMGRCNQHLWWLMVLLNQVLCDFWFQQITNCTSCYCLVEWFCRSDSNTARSHTDWDEVSWIVFFAPPKQMNSRKSPKRYFGTFPKIHLSLMFKSTGCF